MKKYIGILLMSLFVASCAQQEMYYSDIDSTFYAEIEQPAPDDLTKTYYDTDSDKVLWDNGDLLTLFTGTSAPLQYKFVGGTGVTGGRLILSNESGATSGESVSHNYAVYPYSEYNGLDGSERIVIKTSGVQTYPGFDSFGENDNIMVAASDNTSFSFKNACGWIILGLSGEGQVSSITLQGNANEIIAGDFAVTATVGGNPAIEPRVKGTKFTNLREITLECPNPVTLSSTMTDFWIVVPPTVFSNGFSFTVTDPTGRTCTKDVPVSYTVERARYRRIATTIAYPAAVENIVFADENLEKILVTAFDNNGDGELSFAEAASVTDSRTLKSAFNEEKSFSSFDEFQFFTGISNLNVNGMFRDWSITSIIIPNSVIEMSGEYMFTDCKNLSSVTLPDGLKTIGYDAFKGCSQLLSISIPESVMSIRSSAFSESGLTSISIPNSVKSIDNSVFNSCTSLAAISLPDNLMSIGYRSFYHCESLKSVTIGESVTSIGQDSFLGCSSLEKIMVLSSNPPIGQASMFKGTNSCPIYIPAGSADAYLSAMYWKDYSLRLNDGSRYLGYYSSDYSMDGEVTLLQKASVGKGINIIFLGDGFLDKDMEDGGLYDQKMNQAMEQFFAYEPYTTFRDRFNVYAVKVVSSNSEFSEDADRRLTYHSGESIYMRTSVSTEYAELVPNPNNQPLKIAVLSNTDHRVARSWCFWDSSGWSCCFVFDSIESKVLNHELGGHGFANLYDEYVEKNESFSSFDILDNDYNSFGFGANVDWHNTISSIRWSRLMNDPRYSEEGLGIIEGGYLYAHGIYRATENSMMRYNDSPFNAPSREQIYKRIMKYSEGDDWQYDYETFVSYDEAGRRQAAEAFSTKVSSTSVRKASSHEKRDLPPLLIDSGVKTVGVDDKGSIEIVR